MQQNPLRRFRGAFLVLLCLLGPLAAALLAGDDELVKEFKKYFRKFKDTATRVEAVLALEGEQSPAVVGAMLPVLKDKDPEVAKAATQVLAAFKDRPPIDKLILTLAEEKDESIRLGILDAFAIGKYSGTKDGLLVCLEDKVWEVRRRAVLALSAAKLTETAPQIAPLVDAKEVAVRCAAIEALGNLHSELVVLPAITALTDESWQVRDSALEALGVVRDKRSIEPLIDALDREEGRLQEDAVAALENITGRAFGLRKELWRRFWNNNKDRYEIPTDEEMAKLRAKQKEIRENYKPEGSSTFHGIDTPSRSILFIIDVSGSMEDSVTEVERFADGDYPSMRRIDIVKTELGRTIEGLEDYVEFNILAFATEVKSWKKGQVRANVLNKKSAMDFAKGLEAIGGQSKQDLARNGLGGSANLAAGKTNTYGALMRGLDADEDADKKHARTGSYDIGIDTIFFLSDGRPTHGKFTDTDDVLREVKTANELRKVVIHTIAIGKFQKTFMELLARGSGGEFVDLGE